MTLFKRKLLKSNCFDIPTGCILIMLFEEADILFTCINHVRIFFNKILTFLYISTTLNLEFGGVQKLN